MVSIPSRGGGNEARCPFGSPRQLSRRYKISSFQPPRHHRTLPRPCLPHSCLPASPHPFHPYTVYLFAPSVLPIFLLAVYLSPSQRSNLLCNFFSRLAISPCDFHLDDLTYLIILRFLFIFIFVFILFNSFILF